MELLSILAFPILAIFASVFLSARRMTFLVASLLYGLLLVYLGFKGMSVPIHFDTGGISFWGDFVMVPSFYITALNAPLILLLGFSFPFVAFLLREFHSERTSYSVSAWILILGLAGTFISDSLILFYVFFETSLIGAYLWIGMFGEKNGQGSRDSRPGLTRFFLFTLVGSLCMLVSIAGLSSGGRDLRWTDLTVVLSSFSASGRFWLFLGLLAAFVVKLPLFGFHGWLRETYTIAPPAARAVLSGVMSKLGAYGMLLLAVYFGGEFREQSRILMILFSAGVLYGGIVSLGQKKFLDVVIYSSLAHLNLIGLGLAVSSGGAQDASIVAACTLQMFNHGMIMVAVLVYDARLGSPRENHEGLREHSRLLGAFLLVALFAAISLPGLSSFPAEVIILYGSFKASPVLAFASALGLLISAAALIRSYHRNFLGVFRGVQAEGQKAELGTAEALAGIIFAAVWIALGLAPGLMLGPVSAALGMVKL